MSLQHHALFSGSVTLNAISKTSMFCKKEKIYATRRIFLYDKFHSIVDFVPRNYQWRSMIWLHWIYVVCCGLSIVFICLLRLLNIIKKMWRMEEKNSLDWIFVFKEIKKYTLFYLHLKICITSDFCSPFFFSTFSSLLKFNNEYYEAWINEWNDYHRFFFCVTPIFFYFHSTCIEIHVSYEQREKRFYFWYDIHYNK